MLDKKWLEEPNLFETIIKYWSFFITFAFILRLLKIEPFGLYPADQKRSAGRLKRQVSNRFSVPNLLILPLREMAKKAYFPPVLPALIGRRVLLPEGTDSEGYAAEPLTGKTIRPGLSPDISEISRISAETAERNNCF